jgi:hypothetical protein
MFFIYRDKLYPVPSGAAQEHRNERMRTEDERSGRTASYRCNKFDPAGMVLNLIVSGGLLGAYPNHIQPHGHRKRRTYI